MDYKQRLKEFNSTEKYKQEMYFIYSLMQPKKNERIIDYGCGIGTVCTFLLRNTESNVYGHDTRDYFLFDKPHWFIDHIYFPVDKVLFMHSIAHVSGVESVVDNFYEQYLNNRGRIYIITPNKEWLDIKNQGKEYKSDDSVINHFTIAELKELFYKFKIVNCGQFGEELHGKQERLFLIAEK